MPSIVMQRLAWTGGPSVLRKYRTRLWFCLPYDLSRPHHCCKSRLALRVIPYQTIIATPVMQQLRAPSHGALLRSSSRIARRRGCRASLADPGARCVAARRAEEQPFVLPAVGAVVAVVVLVRRPPSRCCFPLSA